MIAVETEDLTKDYLVGFWRKRPVRALDGLTLDIGEGEIFGLLGHNGAGKTTTLKLLLRLIFPTSGKATIFGKPLDAPEILSQIGYLPESPYFYDYLTCRELLDYYAQLAGLHGPDRNKRVCWALERLGMSEFADRALRKCSKGMMQRVGLAQAIVHRPRLLFLDEPMSGLDPLGRREVRELMLELRAGGATVVFSTHILSDAEEICDRVAILQQGRLRAVTRPAEWLDTEGAQWELVWRNSRSAVPEIPGATVTARGDYRATVAKTEVWAVLERLRNSGADIVSVTPARQRLEDIFVRQTGSPPATHMMQAAEEQEHANVR